MYTPTVAQYTLNAADEILCYTETDRDRLRKQGIVSPITVVPNGIDCQRFRPRQCGSSNQILFVGRLKPGKGVRSLIDAFERVLDEFPDYKLKIVGDGPLRGKLTQLAEDKNLDSNVEFAGHVENGCLADIYSKSQLFVLPSQNEGLPRTVLEAMACEIPVITSNLDQLEPVVEGAGYTVPPGYVTEMTESILELLTNPGLRNELGETGRDRVQSDYCWQETVIETLNKYHDLTS